MPRNPPMSIVFPKLGVLRRGGLRPEGRQSEFGTPWSYNVRLEDSLTNRLRGGSFTGQAAGTKSAPVYRDRAITFSGGIITAARQGVSSDKAMSTDVSDVARPMQFQLSEAGSIGPNVVAVVPHKDMYLLCFSATETWVLAGNPTTGTFRRISDEVGVIGASAWCVNHDTVYFLSSRGLYAVGADGSGLQAVSEDRIPEHMIGLSDTAAVLDYNHANRGVYVHLTTAPSWFYDTAREGFWPFDLTETGSHLLLGPLHLGQGDFYGRIQSLHGNMASGSADVTWRVVTGETAEEAAANGKAAIEAAVAGNNYSSYVKASGTWSAGRAHMGYPRTRTLAFVLWLSAESDWAYEAVAMTRVQSGRWR